MGAARVREGACGRRGAEVRDQVMLVGPGKDEAVQITTSFGLTGRVGACIRCVMGCVGGPLEVYGVE